jgi:hypothetical protein
MVEGWLGGWRPSDAGPGFDGKDRFMVVAGANDAAPPIYAWTG